MAATTYDWKWMPNSAKFQPNFMVHSPEFGKQTHGFGSPYWEFEMTLPPIGEKDRREIARLFGVSRGTAVINVYDPRVPIPAYYSHLKDDPLLKQRIPDVMLSSVDMTNSTVTIHGTEGDRITMDDPIAFDHNGLRHYYRSSDNLTLSGELQTLGVYLQPRVAITTLVADDEILLDRINPTCRFVIYVNDRDGLTNADGYTSFKLKGVEYWGVL